MPRVKVEVEGFQCSRCGHKWIPRLKNEIPSNCPTCQTRKWDWPKDPLTGKLVRPAHKGL